MSFLIPKFTDVVVRSLNVRAEMHGKDPVPAVDIGFTLTSANDFLDMIDPGLKRALYRAEQDGEETEPELEGVEPISDLRALRATSLRMPLKLNREYVGRNLVIDYGTGGKSNIELFGDINEISVDAKEGGSTDTHFRFQASGIKDRALGTLGTLVKHTVKITCLSSEEAGGTAPIGGTEDKGPNPFKYSVKDGKTVDNNPAPSGDKGDGPTATDIFAAGGSAEPAKAKAEGEKLPKKKPAAKK